MDYLKGIKTEITLKNKSIPVQIPEELFKDTVDGIYTCDLIIKCGKNLFEYSAHRIILAAASEFLYEALSTAVPGTISVLILPDIEPKTLKQLLKYIYHGEITLETKQDVQKFIEACEFLKIQTPTILIGETSDEQNNMTIDEIPEIEEIILDIANYDNEEKDFSSNLPENQETFMDLSIKKDEELLMSSPILEPELVPIQSVHRIESSKSKILKSRKNTEQLEKQQRYKCEICGLDYSLRYSLILHKKRKHELYCQICEKTFKNPFFLKMHKQAKHSSSH